MGRSSRVLSFMSAFGGPPRSPTSASPSNPPFSSAREEVYSSSSPQHLAGPARDSPPPARTKAERPPSSRPMSMIQTYQPPLMEIAQDTIPELQPIFTFLNSHSNKLYQEGYFLKLHDLDSQGRPNADRTWTECFAQLVGTVLSLWDAGALDVAGEDGEVAPTFINLADASIKMIETLPTRSQDAQALQNVLSVSTAGKNRYLFHFNSLHSLTQWTAGIRLAMFEHATLQEAYTGSLIAGKGKSLNNIKSIMDRSKLKTEDWARVRFGAGTPWRRCWCVISPPDEKEIQKQQRSLKKRSAYDRSSTILKGDVKFYDTKKIKKARPIATITDAYSAYAIYPQSKPLIDQSTLVKVEGTITIHSAPETITEGFVFVMPEAHPAVTGFEMMLRWLFPVYDVFGLYGRPNRLVADTLDVRSLMFAMPQEKRYGYLEILDVAGLIHSEGSQTWKEKDWRKQLKELTAKRITSLREGTTRSRMGSRTSSNRGHRNSLPGRNGTLRFDDTASIQSSPSIRHDTGSFAPPSHTDSAPPSSGPSQPPRTPKHQRSVSEANAFSTPRQQRSISEAQQNYTPSRLSYEATPPMPYEAAAPPPPAHRIPVAGGLRTGSMQRYGAELEGTNERSSSESERRYRGPIETVAEAQEIRQDLQPNSPPAPVVAPPAFAHQPGAKPPTRPYHSAELRRANSRMSTTTLSQLAEAGNFQNPEGVAAVGAAAAWRTNQQQGVGTYTEDHQKGVNDDASKSGMIANHSSLYEGMVLAEAGSTSRNAQPLPALSNDSSQHFETSPIIPNGSRSQSDSLLPPSPRALRSTSPLSQSSTYLSTPPDQTTLKVIKNFSRLPPQQPSQDLQSQPPMSDSASIIMKPPPEPIEPERPELLKRHSTSRSINRKPVPGQTQQAKAQEQPVLPARSSRESLRQHAVGQDSLADEVASKSLHSTTSNNFNARRRSDNSSKYDDESIVSPDYASTRKSVETSRSVEKPRTGVLRTVGTVEAVDREVQVGDVHYRPDQRQDVSADIPSIDFGPTHALNPGSASRPGTGNVGQTPHEKTVSAERPSTASQLNGGIIYTNRNSPGRPNGPNHSRSSSRNLTTPEPGHGRSSPADVTNERPRSVAWQPGTTIGSGSPNSRQSITPEQFVQQRAASGRVTPIYAHAAKRSATPPPLSRNSSGDWSQQQVRVTPTKEPPRPQSRVVSPMLNASAGDYTAHLSAREQEHVARVTRSPLISVPRQGSQGGGLIGAIEAREREKKDMKEGWGGQMVQNAIAQRQQQAQGHQYGQQSQAQPPNYQYGQQAFPIPSPQLAMPGQYPQTPQIPNPSRMQSQYGVWNAPQTPQYNPQQQQQWVSPVAQLYWSTPQAPSPYSQDPYQQGQHQQGQYQQGQPQQGQFQQGQFQQGHQQNGSYFGNVHGGR